MNEFAYVTDITIKYIDLITELVKQTGCKKYLELGASVGNTLHDVRKYCDRCVGVDITDKRSYFDFDFVMMNTDDFFLQNTEMFDIVFIDADHSFESVKKDFENALLVLSEFGIIIIHDTDPLSKYYVQPGRCGDSYRIVDWIEENHSELNTFTLPILEAGMTIVGRKKDRRVNKYI